MHFVGDRESRSPRLQTWDSGAALATPEERRPEGGGSPKGLPHIVAAMPGPAISATCRYPRWRRALFLKRFFDRANQLRRVRLDSGLEPGDHLAIFIHQELGEIPTDLTAGAFGEEF